jgi:protein MpaA
MHIVVLTQPVLSADAIASVRPESVAWEPLGRSVENRLVEFVQLGSGERNVMLVPAMQGNDPLGVEMAERLAAHLVRFPNWLTGLRLTIVRDPNPDGRIRHTAANAHGVEIDRNFRTRRWRKVRDNNRWISGREPETEPETRMLADLMADVRPARVIVLASAVRQPWLGFGGPAEAWARRVGDLLGAAPHAIDPSAAPGSLAAYAAHDRDIATLVMQIPVGRSPQRAWTDYKRAMLSAIDDFENGAASTPQVAMPDAARVVPDRSNVAANSESSVRQGGPIAQTYNDSEMGTTLVPVIGRHEGGWHGVSAPAVSVAPSALDHAKAPMSFEDPTAPRTFLPVSSGRLPARPVAERVDHVVPKDPIQEPQRSVQQPIPFYPDTGRD